MFYFRKKMMKIAYACKMEQSMSTRKFSGHDQTIGRLTHLNIVIKRLTFVH